MAKPKKMSESELAGAIDGQITDSSAYHRSEIARHNENALRFFRGDVDIAPMGKNRSRVVSRDVSDTHGLILPSLLRVFFSSDRVALFQPTRREHEEYADQATDLVNYVVMKESDGYRHLRNAMSDALLHGNGIVKHWWDATPEYKVDNYTGQTQDQYDAAVREAEIEILEEESYPDPEWEPDDAILQQLEQAKAAAESQGVAFSVPPEAQQLLEPPILYDFTAKRLMSKGRFRMAALPYPEFRIDQNATYLDETVPFVAHVYQETRSELIRQGYDKAKVSELPRYTLGREDRHERDKLDTVDYGAQEAMDASTELVEIHECYVLVDWNGDGVAERRRVVMGGQTGKMSILANEEWDGNLPFTDIVPDPQSHRWRGRGIFDLMADIQRIKTMTLRGVMDAAYKQLKPKKYIAKNSLENDMWEAEADDEFGAMVEFDPAKGPPPKEQVGPSLAPEMFPLMDYLDGVGEKRTGISQRSQALDLDALQNQSATAVNAAQAAAFSKVEDYARNIVECGGLKRFFGCVLRILTKHMDTEKTINLRGRMVEMPAASLWDADMMVSVNTGLGTGSRDKDYALLGGIIGQMKESMAAFGPVDGPITIKDLFEAQQKQAEAAGINNPEAFFPDVSDDQLQQMRDMMAKKAQAAQQGQMQAEMAKFQQQTQVENAKAQAAILRDREKLMADIQMEREKMAADLQRDREEMLFKFELKRQEMGLEAELTALHNAQTGAMDFNIEGAR